MGNKPHNEQPVSLAPIPFDEAVTDLLKTKPERKQDKLEALDRAGKNLAGKDAESGKRGKRPHPKR